ncbi:MAG: hypothetical protein JSR76_08350 [Verrucomicrobia bacterium]|nr:hypothetical protein [Verrucomicrobiota bacterium]
MIKRGFLAKYRYKKGYRVSFSKDDLENLKSKEFKTHTNSVARSLHYVGRMLFSLARLNTNLAAYTIQPKPGRGKEQILSATLIRFVSFFFWAVTLPFTSLSFFLGVPFWLISHRYRPILGYLAREGSESLPFLEEEKPLFIRTHNTALVFPSLSTLSDLRSPVARAGEVVRSILEDELQPDILFFQEVFYEKAAEILGEGLLEAYPYILHTIAPCITDFTSGSFIASKYPFKEVRFERLEALHTFGKIFAKGVTVVRIATSKGDILFYNVHLQPALNEKRAKVRLSQLEQIVEMIKKDKSANRDVLQVLVGDFNISRLTILGEDHLVPEGQVEAKLLSFFEQHFEDPYLYDHDSLTGIRTRGAPFYLAKDNARMGESLEEPRGSWYEGPFVELQPVWFFASSHIDALKSKSPKPEKVPDLEIPKSKWGTKKWHKEQMAHTARFDYTLFPKEQKELIGRTEIRRVAIPKGTQSAPTDHLPVDTRIYKKEKK